jgi:thiamine-phosphate pyrophosphorylase
MKLARAAARLNAQSGHAELPPLIFLTDDERTPDPLPAIANLPRGSLIIVRSRNPNRRRQLAHAAARIAQRRGLSLSIANDAQLASEVAADGLHLSEAEIEQAGRYRSKSWLITAAAHSAHAVMRAHLSGAHAVLLSPIFETRSHKERTPLGLTRLRTIARTSPIPIYALGGIDAENVESLKNIPLAGIAAIGALLPKQGNPNRILREAP